MRNEGEMRVRKTVELSEEVSGWYKGECSWCCKGRDEEKKR